MVRLYRRMAHSGHFQPLKEMPTSVSVSLRNLLRGGASCCSGKPDAISAPLHPRLFAYRSLFATFLSQTQPTSQAGAAASSHTKRALARSTPNCTSKGTYINNDGQSVPRAENCLLPPKRASAQCRDGSYSFRQSRRGTCSHTVGWLNGSDRRVIIETPHSTLGSVHVFGCRWLHILHAS